MIFLYPLPCFIYLISTDEYLTFHTHALHLFTASLLTVQCKPYEDNSIAFFLVSVASRIIADM